MICLFGILKITEDYLIKVVQMSMKDHKINNYLVHFRWMEILPIYLNQLIKLIKIKKKY